MDETAGPTYEAPMAVPAVARPRQHLLDLARGIAMIAVVVYHFCWDLEQFGIHYLGLLEAPFWLVARTMMAGGFLAIAGAGLVLAADGGLDARRYWWRLSKIVAAAALVTAFTYWQFPGAGVFFGILHLIALSSIIALPFLRLPWWATSAVAALLFSLDYAPQPWLSEPWLLWLGMGTGPVDAVDYVPIVPWFGFVLLGIVTAKLALASRAWPRLAAIRLADPVSTAVRFVGRHTLLIYLVHQPILFGLFYAYFYLAT